MGKRRFPINSFWDVPRSLMPWFWEGGEWELEASYPSGLSVYEDEKNFYVEAALPGLAPSEIEVSCDKGYVLIEGEKKEEEKEKKYYRKASSSFSYRIALPSSVDETEEPKAVMKNGIMKITFTKGKKAKKTIQIKEE
jgi:HSP20 family protein